MNNMEVYKYNPYESRILEILVVAHRPLTTRQVSMYTGISYNTTSKYLSRLKKKGKIKKNVDSNKIYWSVNLNKDEE